MDQVLLKTAAADCLEEMQASKTRRNPWRGVVVGGHLFIPNRHVHAPYPTRPLFALSAEQLQVDFVEMLRIRSEKRRLRHVEALQRQKQEEEEGEDGETGEESGGRGRTPEVKDGEPGDEVFRLSSKPQSPCAAVPRSPDSKRTDTTHTEVGGQVNRLV